MSSFDQLRELRHQNKRLLQRLMAKQAFILEQTQSNAASQSNGRHVTSLRTQQPSETVIRVTGGQEVKAREALYGVPGSKLKSEYQYGQQKTWRDYKSFQLVDENGSRSLHESGPCSERCSKALGDCQTSTPFRERNVLEINQSQMTCLQEPLYKDQLLDVGNVRLKESTTQGGKKPKSILAMQQSRERKGEVHVTFQADMEYHENLCEKAFLGYDWIAGQLDAESSLSDQSEEYFTELRNFRQVNKDECFFSSIVREEDVEFTAPPLVEPQLDLLPSLDTHQCTHCYRVDRRLFTVPLEPEAACAICKLPRNHLQSSEQKPAFIRISIPRSTLLPAYKYKAHRRKSFDPTDSLSLPSHCLSGWSNNGSLSTSHSNSFGIRKSCSVSGVLNGKLLSLLHDKNSEEPIISSDELLSLSHAAEYHFQNMEGPTRTVPTSGDSVY